MSFHCLHLCLHDVAAFVAGGVTRTTRLHHVEHGWEERQEDGRDAQVERPVVAERRAVNRRVPVQPREHSKHHHTRRDQQHWGEGWETQDMSIKTHHGKFYNII